MEQASILWQIYKNKAFKDLDTYPQDQQLTETEFDALVTDNPDDWKGTAWYARITWLATNGYDLTQENILDDTLPSRD